MSDLKATTSAATRLLRLLRAAEAQDRPRENAEETPDPAIHRAIALHRESLRRHRELLARGGAEAGAEAKQ
jgi:hypothetical protein